MGLLVSSGCHNKILQSRWLKQQVFCFFFSLTVLEAASPRSGRQHGLIWMRALFLASRQLPSYCVLHVSSSSNKSANPIMGALPLGSHINLISSQGPYLQITSHWAVEFQHMNGREGKPKPSVHSLRYAHIQFFTRQFHCFPK